MQCSPTQYLSVVNQVVLTVYTSRHARYCMLFASKAFIYLNKERGKAARNYFINSH